MKVGSLDRDSSNESSSLVLMLPKSILLGGSEEFCPYREIELMRDFGKRPRITKGSFIGRLVQTKLKFDGSGNVLIRDMIALSKQWGLPGISDEI